MDSLALALLVFAGLAGLYWWADRRAAEQATRVARKACADAGVLWLDQNVRQVRKRLARDPNGRLRWQRDFEFEFSQTGEERQWGRIRLLGQATTVLVGPEPMPLLWVGRDPT